MIDDVKTDEILSQYEILGTTNEWRKKLIFLSTLLYANRLQTACDKIDDRVSIKQWVMLIMTVQYKNPPTLSQLSEVLGCSRQNVKKIALTLEKKGYINLVRGEKDGRALAVVLTEKTKEYFDGENEKQMKALETVFSKLNEDEISELFKLLLKLYGGIEELEKEVDLK